jgi:hypothetical protein
VADPVEIDLMADVAGGFGGDFEVAGLDFGDGDAVLAGKGVAAEGLALLRGEGGAGVRGEGRGGVEDKGIA